ncbi:MAG: glycosyltransferase family 1 protein [Dehalococcoidia bacterium]|nr:MAG: glycosyltransferase family 1 protein [Dehalococcoidia bacterium]
MILVTTDGIGSMDQYAAALAARLPEVRQLPTSVYERSVRRFNQSLLSAGTLRSLYLDVEFVRLLREQDDAIHFPNHHLARYGRFLRQPYVVTVHDLIRYFDLKRRTPLIHRPNLRDRLYLGLDYGGIRHASAVIAVSRTTKADLVEHLGVDESRVHVVYEGIDHQQFRPVDARPFEFPYLLFVGSEQPRKNLAALIEAFACLKRSGAHPDLRLVKVGAAGGRESDYRAETERLVAQHGVGDFVIFDDRVHPEALPAYYAGAECTVMPSLYEGFGFPVLEAMACGSPVVASSGGSLPEIAGEAAALVSPRDPEAIATAIGRILAEPWHREDLRVRGIQRAAEFTWERAARETQEVYEQFGQAPAPLRQVVSSM